MDWGFDLVGIATDPGSGLTPKVAQRLGVHLLDPSRPLGPQYRELLLRYDRVLSLHASEKVCPVIKLAIREAEATDPRRVLVHDTGLGSAGLGAAVQRASELLLEGAEETAILEELRRLRQEGRFLLLSGDLRALVKNRLLPPLGDRFGEALGLWALLTMERGSFKVPPLPVPQNQVPEVLATTLRRFLRRRRVRVRALFGRGLDPALQPRLKEALAKELVLESGSLGPMDPLATSRVGEKAIAVFAYPI